MASKEMPTGDQEAGNQPAPVAVAARKRRCNIFSRGRRLEPRHFGRVVGMIVVLALIVLIATLAAQLVVDKGNYNDLFTKYNALVNKDLNAVSRVPSRDVVDAFFGDEAPAAAVSESFTSTTTATFFEPTLTVTVGHVDAGDVQPFLVSGAMGVSTSSTSSTTDSFPPIPTVSRTTDSLPPIPTVFPTMTDVSNGISPPDCAAPTGTVSTKTVTVSVESALAPSTSWFTWTSTSEGTAVATNSISIVLGKPGTTTEFVTVTEHSISTAPAITEGASTGDVTADTTVAASTSSAAVPESSASSTGAVESGVPAMISSHEIVLPTVTIVEETDDVSGATITKTISVESSSMVATTTISKTTTETSSSDTRPNLGGVPQTPPADWSSTRYSTTSYWTTVTRITTPPGAVEAVTTVTSGFEYTTSTIVDAVSGGSPPSASGTWTAAVTLPTELSHPTTEVLPIPLFPNSTANSTAPLAAMTTELQTLNATLLTTAKTTLRPTTSALTTSSDVPVIGAAKRNSKPGGTGGYCIVMIVMAVAIVLI